MRSLKKYAQLLLVFVASIASFATSSVGERETSYFDETWVVTNLFDGQTAVPLDHQIRLSIGYRDFTTPDEPEITDAVRKDAERILALIRITDLQSEIDHPFSVEVYEDHSVLNTELFAQDRDYELFLGDLQFRVLTTRQIPFSLSFSTMSRPQVTGVWRVEDTLLITFSEPMDAESLSISQNSIDLLFEENNAFEEGKELRSIAADMNLADFVLEAEDDHLRFGPIPEIESGWLKVSRDVTAMTGVTLDGNGDAQPGQVDDDFVEAVNLLGLPECYTRGDIPQPCVTFSELPDFEDDAW